MLCALALTLLMAAPCARMLSRVVAQASSAPDVVVLADGGFVRGTLVENAPGQYAVLLTLGGQLRRFEASELSYAGPVEAMPKMDASGTTIPVNEPRHPPTVPVVTASAPAASDTMVEIRFEASNPIEIMQRMGVSTTTSGSATGESYAPLCIAPCTATLRPGMYTLGLARTGAAPLNAGTLMLSEGSVIEASYESRLGVRVAGIFVTLAGVGGGLALMLGGIEDGGQLSGQFWAGAVVSGIGTIAGLIMGRIPDAANVRARR